jgi:hypothetical protein
MKPTCILATSWVRHNMTASVPAGLACLGGPCRIQTDWADINAGLVYTDRISGRFNGTLLGWFACKHNGSVSEEDWRARILSGAVRIGGIVEMDPDASLP